MWVFAVVIIVFVVSVWALETTGATVTTWDRLFWNILQAGAILSFIFLVTRV